MVQESLATYILLVSIVRAMELAALLWCSLLVDAMVLAKLLRSLLPVLGDEVLAVEAGRPVFKLHVEAVIAALL